jgi:putative phosphoribosyl transferase
VGTASARGTVHHERGRDRTVREETTMRFPDRRAAGKELAGRLASLAAERPIVLGLPRGGVVVADEIATALAAELDVVIVRKIGAPGRPELAAGAVGERGVLVLNEDVVGHLRISEDQLTSTVELELAELSRRAGLYRAGRPPLEVSERTVILVDDGIATGATVSAALRVLREIGARRIVLAVPVAAQETLQALAEQVDEIVCLRAPAMMRAVGASYREFNQVEDAEVIEILSH